MPPFQYDQYRNPYVQSISQLIEAPGQIEAQRALQSGNAWAQAAQTAGSAIGGIPQQMEAQKMNALKMQDIKAQVEERNAVAAQRKQQQADLVALDKAMATPGGLEQVLKATPGHLQPQVLKSYEEAQKLGNEAKAAAESARKMQAEHFGFLGAQIKQQNYDPAAALAAIHQARETYSDDPGLLKQIDAMRMRVIEQPEAIKGMADAAILGSSYKDMLKPERPIEHDPTKELLSPTGTVLKAAQPKAETPKEYEVTTVGPKGQPMKILVTADTLRKGVNEYRAPSGEKETDQNKLEQQYRTVLMREVSSRSGTLGTEDAKVASANHLLAMFHQAYDPKTGDFNIPKVQQTELALGLARMLSPTGQVGIQMEQEINQATAKGDFNKVMTYVTGQPFNGSTQAVYKMFKDSIERQGQVAFENRQAAIKYLQGLAPTELDPKRREALESNSLTGLWQIREAKDASGTKSIWISKDGGKTWAK